ncbi:hypothetical protein [Commensalibacter communis]|uniref:hypothetical protein n=1 Tax=Commensalibacter communis TaxID=2972786 RepID=UPI0022FF635C|nr:hypothetical protein [Commensalibacter communis]CAI3926857.1 unnamed protein product [Commensalibacter communis]CAI3927813.1 unnamed protein product [Commensalibacter communis]
MQTIQTKILRQKIYNTICYECNIRQEDFTPDLLLNFGEYEQFGESADDLTFEAIPATLGIPSSYHFPFDNSLYFRDDHLITLVGNLFKKEKHIRPRLTVKQYTDMILALYEEYLKEENKEQKRTAILITKAPQEQKDHLQKKLFALLMQTLSIEQEDFSANILINEGQYKVSGRKAERLIHQSALCLHLSKDEVYNHFKEKNYFDLPTPIIGWILIFIFSPIILFAFIVTSIIYCITFIIRCGSFIMHGKWEDSALFRKPPQNKHKPITANEYVYELLGLWSKEQEKLGLID